MATPINSLKHADGTVVTAQEAHDAFMNTRVLIVSDGTTYEAISMLWYDNNSAQNNPAHVGYVKLSYVTKVNTSVVINEIEVGNSSVVPTAG